MLLFPSRLKASEGNSVGRARSGWPEASHSLAVVLRGGNLIVSGAEERGRVLHEVPEGHVGATVRTQTRHCLKIGTRCSSS